VKEAIGETHEAGQHGDDHLNPRLSLMFSLTPPATSATASLALQSQYSVQAKGQGLPALMP